MMAPNPAKNVVFYADDDPDDIEFLRECFDQHAHNVQLTTFLTGSSLISHLHQGILADIPCLILLDVNMPVMDGKETLHLLRQLPSFETVPVILFTTSSLAADAEFARKHKAGYLTKPLHYSQMRHIMEQLLEHCPDDLRKRLRKMV